MALSSRVHLKDGLLFLRRRAFARSDKVSWVRLSRKRYGEESLQGLRAPAYIPCRGKRLPGGFTPKGTRQRLSGSDSCLIYHPSTAYAQLTRVASVACRVPNGAVLLPPLMSRAFWGCAVPSNDSRVVGVDVVRTWDTWRVKS